MGVTDMQVFLFLEENSVTDFIFCKIYIKNIIENKWSKKSRNVFF